jgi:cytochrome oxidase Cu insertion factor (SCO1/SenC/PrrC family)
VRVAILFAFLLSPSSLLSQSRKFDEFTTIAPLVGDIAPDFTLQTLDGEEFTLSKAYASQPVVIEFGSYT